MTATTTASPSRSSSATTGPVESRDPIESPAPGDTSQDAPAAAVAAQPSLAAKLAVPIFAGLLAVGTAILLIWGPIAGLGPVRSLIAQPLVAALLTITFVAVTLGPVSVHYRGQTYLFALSEVPMLLGLVIAAPAVLVICRVLAELFVLGVIRRIPAKLAFNLASGAGSCVGSRPSFTRQSSATSSPPMARVSRSSPSGGQPGRWRSAWRSSTATWPSASSCALPGAPGNASTASSSRPSGSRTRLEHRPRACRARRSLVGHLGSRCRSFGRCPHRVRLSRLPAPHDSFRRAQAALRLHQVGERPVPRDDRNCWAVLEQVQSVMRSTGPS